jgi:hypothetical protein
MSKKLSKLQQELHNAMGRDNAAQLLNDMYDAYLSTAMAGDDDHRVLTTDLYRLLQDVI